MLLKHRRLVVALSVCILAFLLAVAAYSAQYLFVYRPNADTAARYVLNSLQNFSMTLDGTDVRFDRIQVTHIYPLAKAQVVVVAYTQLNDGTPAHSGERYDIDIVSSRWFDGPGILASTGGVYLNDPHYTITLAQMHYDGAYVVGGGTKNDRIVSVRAMWSDGTESVTGLINHTFLLVSPDDAKLTGVVGFDTQGQVVSGSLTYPDPNFSPLDYDAVQQVGVENGIIVMGAYSQTLPKAQECLELTYLTNENAWKYFTPNGAFTGQRVCIEVNGQTLGPSASTVINGATVIIGGRILNASIVSVGLLWSDGYRQTVPVQAGFYFAQRIGASLVVNSTSALDAYGNIFKK